MRNKMHRGVQFALGALLAYQTLIATLTGDCYAQVPSSVIAPVKPPAISPPINPPKAEVHPLWTELTAAQQVALAPLQAEWSKIDGFRKKKWVQISSRFASMKPEEQQRLQENMRIWAKLSPDERRHARETYSRAKSLDREQKSAKWQQYQQLSDAEKKKLSADIAAKKHVANLPNVTNTTNATNKTAIKPPVTLSTPKPNAPAKVTAPSATASGTAVAPSTVSNAPETAPSPPGATPTPAAAGVSK